MSHFPKIEEESTSREPLALPAREVADSLLGGKQVTESRIPHTAGMSRRRFLAVLGASAGVLAVTGHRVFAKEPPKLKVGFLLPEKGPYAAEADSLKAGFELYTKEHASSGTPVEMIVQDPGSDETATLEAVARLVMSEEVQFLVGPPDQKSCERVNHAVADRGTILFVTNPQVRFVSGELCFPGSFRVRPNTYQASRPLAPWALSNLGQTGFFTGNDDPIGNEMADFFAHGFDRAGGRFTDRIMAKDDEGEIGKVLEAVGKLKPDFVFAAFRNSAAVSFMNAVHKAKTGVSCPIIGPESLTEFPSTLSGLGNAASGVKTLTSLKDPVGLVRRIDSELGKKVSHASGAAQGYDIAAVVYGSAKDIGGEKPDLEKLAGSIEGLSIDGAQGKLRFDKNHEPILSVMIQQWEPLEESGKRQVVAGLGECASKDFGCGKVGFPKTPGTVRSEEKDAVDETILSE